MQFTRLLVFLVCASYTLATTCAACVDKIDTVALQNKCYRADGSIGQPETVCTYEEKNGVPKGVSCTYNASGHIVERASWGKCIDVVPVNSVDCPRCLV